MARRKSKTARVHPDIRAHIERRFREDVLTLDEILDEARELAEQLGVPAETLPSRTGLHRSRYQFQELVRRMREQRAIAEVVVGELGDGIGEKSAQLLAESVNAVVTHAALRAGESDDTGIEDARKLARAAKDAIQVQKISRQERQEIERIAQERLLKEQRGKLDAMGKRGEITPEALQRIRTEVYGLPS